MARGLLRACAWAALLAQASGAPMPKLDATVGKVDFKGDRMQFLLSGLLPSASADKQPNVYIGTSGKTSDGQVVYPTAGMATAFSFVIGNRQVTGIVVDKALAAQKFHYPEQLGDSLEGLDYAGSDSCAVQIRLHAKEAGLTGLKLHVSQLLLRTPKQETFALGDGDYEVTDDELVLSIHGDIEVGSALVGEFSVDKGENSEVSDAAFQMGISVGVDDTCPPKTKPDVELPKTSDFSILGPDAGGDLDPDLVSAGFKPEDSVESSPPVSAGSPFKMLGGDEFSFTRRFQSGTVAKLARHDSRPLVALGFCAGLVVLAAGLGLAFYSRREERRRSASARSVVPDAEEAGADSIVAALVE